MPERERGNYSRIGMRPRATINATEGEEVLSRNGDARSPYIVVSNERNDIYVRSPIRIYRQYGAFVGGCVTCV